MSVDENKALVRRFFVAFNAGDLDSALEILAPNAVVHNAGAPDPLDLDGFRNMAAMFLAAFPDGNHSIDDIVGERDKVVTRMTYRGTHTGDLMGIPPTGRKVTVSAMTIDHIVNGKVAETWRLFDQMSMMQQLGLIPAPEPATA
jgi:steroid delta-isomerase-like uncharacterized protein